MDTTVTTKMRMDDENVEKFIKLYGEGDGEFSLSLVIPKPKEWTKDFFTGPHYRRNTCIALQWRWENWGTTTDAMSVEGDGLALHDILRGHLSFNTADTPPVKVFEKMTADGLKFETYLIRESWESGYGKVRNGKFRYEFDSDLDGDGVSAIPVQKLLLSEDGLWEYEQAALIFPCISKSAAKISEYSRIETEAGESLFLLDKNGEKVKGVDYDHSEPDKDGYVYYPVPDSDLKVVGARLYFTEEAKAKWRERLKM